MLSVIIPHLGREKHLALCLNYLERSANSAGLSQSDWEVLIAGRVESCAYGSRRFYVLNADTTPPFLKLRENEPPPFWKNHLLNAGIEHARGDILMFLDADAIVGVYCLNTTIDRLGNHDLTYLTYRVRKIAYGVVSPDCFDEYDKQVNLNDVYPKAHEAYVSPDLGNCDPSMRPIFGNSQFAIRRDVLGGLRFNEEYWGRGFEDLAMLRSLYHRDIDRFRTEIITSSKGAMFHVANQLSPGWNNDRWHDRNERRYYQKKCLWIVASKRSVLESYKTLLCSDWLKIERNRTVRYRLEGDFDIQEANQETDEVFRPETNYPHPTPVYEDVPTHASA